MSNTKKLLISILSSVILFLLIVFLYGLHVYNDCTSKDESINLNYSQIDAQYQRRTDLINNIENVVKGYAKHEHATLTDVIGLRNRGYDDKSNLSNTLGKLMFIVERYPELKANQNFLGLQQQLETTENKVAQYRENSNLSIESYNRYIRRFPVNIIANKFGFKIRQYYKASEKNNVKISF